MVGRKHYTDLDFLTPDARMSAEAVRKVLDSAEAELAEVAAAGATALVASPERAAQRAQRA